MKKAEDNTMIYSKMLHNNIKFEGEILNFRRSNNHGFGIIYLKVLKSNTSIFEKKISSNLIYPYIINDSLAEVYTYISTVRANGEIVSVDSDRRRVTYSGGNKIDTISGINMITESPDIEFVEKYTHFK